MVLLGVVAVIAALALAGSAVAQEKMHFEKVGMINVTMKSVAAGVGLSWGEGRLIFKDKTYPIKISGLSLASVGISTTNIVGDVYNLKNPEDIAGQYTALKAGAAAVVGMSGATARNGKGVVIDMLGDQKGLKVDLGASGFTIEMAK
jgi:hypothetical protein